MDGKEKRSVYLLGITSMINDASSEAIYAILPYYVDNPALIGFFGGLFNGLGNALKLVFGYISDRIGKRKPLVIAGYLTSAVAKTLMALVSLPLLPFMIILDRLGKGIRDSPRDAILGTLKERGYAFGIHRAFDTSGALIGVLLAYFMLNYIGDYRTAMLIAGMIAFLTVFPLLLLPSFETERKREGFVSTLAHLTSGVKHFLIPATLFGFAAISPMLFISASKESLAFDAILYYALYNVFYILSSLSFGRRSDVLGRRKTMLIGAVSMALAYVSMFFGLYLPGFVLYGIGMGAFLPAAFAHIGDVAKAKGTAMGAFQSVYGIAILLSSTVFGILYGMYGNVTFLAYAVIPILAIATV